jgi:hypothetical protein
VWVALPRVDGDGDGGQLGILDRLQQRKEGDAIVRAELDHEVRSAEPQQVVGEPPVTVPRARRMFGIEAFGFEGGIVKGPRSI